MKRRVLVILLALAMLITYIPVVAYADTEAAGDVIAEDQQLTDETAEAVEEPAEQTEPAEDVEDPPAEVTDPVDTAEDPAEEPAEEPSEEPIEEPTEEPEAIELPERPVGPIDIQPINGDKTAGINSGELKSPPQNGWYKEDGKWYYYENGSKFTGPDFFEIGGYYYWFDANGVMQTGWIKEIDAGEIYWHYANSSGVLQSGWVKIGDYWYYFTSDWFDMLTGGQEIDGKYYYFSDKGVMQTGWIKYTDTWTDSDGNTHTDVDWLYANSSGVLQSGWQTIGGKKYYFDPSGFYMYCGDIYEIDGVKYFFSDSGALANGWAKYIYTYESWDTGPKTPYTSWYYTDANGVVQYGWKKIGSSWYYFDSENGYMYYDGYYEIGGKDYYFNGSGALQTGWIKKDWGGGDIEWYYANSSGVLLTGWQKIGTKWYYFEPNYYEMYIGYWVIDGEGYYFDKNGVWVSNPSGWKEDFGYDDWYYFKNGVAVKGWQKISGKWYYFDNAQYPYMYTGYRYVNEDGEYYYFKDNGEWVSSPTGWQQGNDGEWYYFKNGQPVSGWQKISSKWYYFYPSGNEMATGYKYINEDDKYYYFNSSGVWVSNPSGWLKSDGTWMYFSGGNPVTGWKKIDGKWYYFYSDGSMVTGWLELDDNWYYFNSSGVMQTGTLTINGVKYTFKSNGAWDGK